MGRKLYTVEDLYLTLFFAPTATFTVYDGGMNVLVDSVVWNELNKRIKRSQVLSLTIDEVDSFNLILKCGVYLK